MRRGNAGHPPAAYPYPAPGPPPPSWSYPYALGFYFPTPGPDVEESDEDLGSDIANDDLVGNEVWALGSDNEG